MNEPRPTIDRPLPSLAGSLVRGLLGFAARMFVGLLLLIAFVDIVQTQHKYWAESGWKIPYATEQVVWFSKRLSREWWPVFVLLVPPLDLAATILLAWRFREHRWILSAWAQFWLLTAVIILFYVLLTMTIPVTGNLPPPTPIP